MSRTDLGSIWQREYEKALDDGWSEAKAARHADKESQRIYWDLVDQGRQRAKDGDR